MRTSVSPIIQVGGVSKRFGGTQALKGVNLELMPGEVHAFVGENGAGKSTLGKIIAGLYHPDEGQLKVDGEDVGRWETAKAQRHGITMIAQELALVRDLTVEQNVFLGREDSWAGVMKSNLTERFSELEKLVQFDLSPKQKVGELRIADQQKVEIMRALARDARVIVMDEPTSSLTSHETEKLHALIRLLREHGCTVVYVSHFLDDILGVSDRVTVLRDGVLIRTSDAAAETKQTLVSAMLGRELAVSFPARPPRIPETVEPVLSVEHLASESGVTDVSFVVRPGEIVGLLGLVGSGRSEIARAVYGADRLSSGFVSFKGEHLRKRSPRGSVRRGLMFVPEDRHRQGLVLQRPLRENVSLVMPELFARLGVISKAKERLVVQSLAERLGIRPPKIELPASGFSGGNQQKALLGKALLKRPQFVILDEPTRGVDIGAKLTIHKLIVELAAEGIGVLLISSEHEEVMALSHRAYLVKDGSTIGEVNPEHTSMDDLLYRLFNVDKSEEKES